MNYPLISEYIEAIKSAEDNFAEQNYLRPVLGNDEMPVMSVGNFAIGSKISIATSVRCDKGIYSLYFQSFA